MRNIRQQHDLLTGEQALAVIPELVSPSIWHHKCYSEIISHGQLLYHEGGIKLMHYLLTLLTIVGLLPENGNRDWEKPCWLLRVDTIHSLLFEICSSYKTTLSKSLQFYFQVPEEKTKATDSTDNDLLGAMKHLPRPILR